MKIGNIMHTIAIYKYDGGRYRDSSRVGFLLTSNIYNRVSFERVYTILDEFSVISANDSFSLQSAHNPRISFSHLRSRARPDTLSHQAMHSKLPMGNIDVFEYIPYWIQSVAICSFTFFCAGGGTQVTSLLIKNMTIKHHKNVRFSKQIAFFEQWCDVCAHILCAEQSVR